MMKKLPLLNLVTSKCSQSIYMAHKKNTKKESLVASTVCTKWQQSNLGAQPRI